jgi:hypothetical protein
MELTIEQRKEALSRMAEVAGKPPYDPAEYEAARRLIWDIHYKKLIPDYGSFKKQIHTYPHKPRAASVSAAPEKTPPSVDVAPPAPPKNSALGLYRSLVSEFNLVPSDKVLGFITGRPHNNYAAARSFLKKEGFVLTKRETIYDDHLYSVDKRPPTKKDLELASINEQIEQAKKVLAELHALQEKYIR